MPTVKVTFQSYDPNRKYAYTAPEGDWKVGDLAVVDSPKSGMVVVIITEILSDSFPGNKHVVGIVSMDAYNQRKANAARKEEILKQLERANAERAELDRFAHLKADPALASLLTELETLK